MSYIRADITDAIDSLETDIHCVLEELITARRIAEHDITDALDILDSIEIGLVAILKSLR